MSRPGAGRGRVGGGGGVPNLLPQLLGGFSGLGSEEAAGSPEPGSGTAGAQGPGSSPGPGGGGPGGIPDELVPFLQTLRILGRNVTAVAGAPGAKAEPPNPRKLSNEWEPVPVGGPTLVVPLTVPLTGSLLFHPDRPPFNDLLALEAIGPGFAFLPTAGTWWMKYTGADANNVFFKLLDASNPGLLSWYLARAWGVPRPQNPVRFDITNASVQILAPNANRAAAVINGLGPSTGHIVRFSTDNSAAVATVGARNGRILPNQGEIEVSGPTAWLHYAQAISFDITSRELIVQEWLL